MYRPRHRSHRLLTEKRVLLIDCCQATREIRASVLRNYGIEVKEAEDLSTARFLWTPYVYDLVMLDVRRVFLGRDARILRAVQGCKCKSAVRLPDGLTHVPVAYLARRSRQR